MKSHKVKRRITEEFSNLRDSKDIDEAEFLKMYAPAQTSPSSIEDIVNHVFDTRRITRLDQQHFMKAALSNTLSSHDHALINQVFDALQRGMLRVVD